MHGLRLGPVESGAAGNRIGQFGTSASTGPVLVGLARARTARPHVALVRIGDQRMAIKVEIYTSGGMAGGILARSGSLRTALSTGERLEIERATWQGLDDAFPRPAGSVDVAVDEVILAVADDAPDAPVHAAWHHVVLESGPYKVEGDLATLPGFDPGRSLARPSGEFVLLRDVRLSLRDRPESGVSVGDHALVNRYAVERIQADLMLGFFFPGAAITPVSTKELGPVLTQAFGGVA